jgi:hypothetical protein
MIMTYTLYGLIRPMCARRWKVNSKSFRKLDGYFEDV